MSLPTSKEAAIAHATPVLRSAPSWGWLRAQTQGPRFGFLRRDGTGLLGAGVEEHVSGASIVEILDEVGRRGGTWFVGASFDPTRERAAWWSPFGPASAWKPERTFALPMASPPTHPPRPLVGRQGAPPVGRSPDRDGWGRLVDLAVGKMHDGDLTKVVLARTISETTAVGPIASIQRPLGPREMAFLFEPEPGVSFGGITPELLFDRVGRRVHSEALAGTDVSTPEGRERLRASEKIAREHNLVVDAVSASLGPLCERLDRSPLHLTDVGRLVHRLVTFDGHLREGAGDGELAASLHPTPAVAGTPTEDARAFLREHEPFDRGWYAGPVGLIEPGRTTLSVALRCALWHGTTRVAYAGAGLVAGSVAQAEWDETELKSLVMRHL